MAEGSNKIGVVIQAKLDENQAYATIQNQLRQLQNKFKKMQIDVKINFDSGDIKGLNEAIRRVNTEQQNQQKKLTNQRLSDEQKIATTQQKNAEKVAAQQAKSAARIEEIAKLWNSLDNDNLNIKELNKLLEQGYRNQAKQFQERIQQEVKIAQTREKHMLQAESTIARFRQKYANINYDEAELRRILDIEQRIVAARQTEGKVTTSLAHQLQLMRQELRQFENGVRATQTQMNNITSTAERELAITRQIERARLDVSNTLTRFQQRYAGVNYDESELRRILNIEERINLARRQGGNIQANINHQIQLMRREMQQFENAVRASQAQMRGINTQSVSLLGSIKKFVQFYVIGDIFMQAERAVRSMYTTVRDLDTSMMELKKITAETEQTYERFLDKAAEKAAALGSTTKDVVDATAEFARTGASFAKSQELAESAIIYTKVSQNATAEDAAAVLISTMAAFEKQGLKSIDVVDKLNNVSNKYSITNEGLGEALKRSASAMHEANNTLDETIALITAANTISQDPEMVGIF